MCVCMYVYIQKHARIYTCILACVSICWTHTHTHTHTHTYVWCKQKHIGEAAEANRKLREQILGLSHTTPPDTGETRGSNAIEARGISTSISAGTTSISTSMDKEHVDSELVGGRMGYWEAAAQLMQARSALQSASRLNIWYLGRNEGTCCVSWIQLSKVYTKHRFFS